MLFRCMTTTILLLFCACARIKGQGESSKEIYNVFMKRVERTLRIRPDVDNSCYVTHSGGYPLLHLICATETVCHLKYSYEPYNPARSLPSFISPFEDVCKSTYGASLPVNKAKQLNAVLGSFGLTNDSSCAFSSLETLTAIDRNFFNFSLLGGSNDNASDITQCPPSRLTYLSLSLFRIGHLSNTSLRQFGQLEYLLLDNSRIESIADDAFSHMAKLKAVLLYGNPIKILTVNLFANNVHLQYALLWKNQLVARSLKAFSRINSLRFLNLTDNKISFTNKQDTVFPNLEELDISSNKVRRLKSELRNLSKLLELRMYNSSIREVSENAFQDLRKVKIINLKRNDINWLSKDTFRNTLELEDLHLSNNKLSELPPVGHLNNLVLLDLSNNTISSINETDLDNCTRLSLIDLSHNKLSFIEEGSFRNVKRLEHLILDHNRLSKLPADFNTFHIIELRLHYNSFTSFSCKMVPVSTTKVSISFNKIETIEAFDFGGQTWSLKNLNLSHNKIQSIDNLTLPPSIKSINLSYNKISRAFSTDDIRKQKLYNLLSIDLRANNITLLCESSFMFPIPDTRTEYSIAGNPFQCSGELNWLRYYLNKVGTIFIDLNQTLCQSTMPKNDGLLALSKSAFLSRSDPSNKNRCLCPQPFDMECQLSCLYNCTCYSDHHLLTAYLMCNSKEFKHIPTDLTYVNEYKNIRFLNLDFSGNLISYIGPLDFRMLNKNICALDLVNCRITLIDSHAFDHLPNLFQLNLRNNQLEALPHGLFHQTTWLFTLDLSNNRLRHLANDAFASLVNLEELYLHSNSLKQLQLHQIKRLESLKNISLHDNPWSCDCAFINLFQVFLVNSSIPVYKKTDIDCTEAGQKFKIPNFNIEHCFKQVNDQSTMLIATLTCGVVLIIIAGLVFKWRYELQVLIYSRYNLRMFHRTNPDEEVEGKLFDAFMAYSSEDSEFLVEQLLPGLERIAKPYRVLVHERDFLAGRFIQDNIIEAVEISSRTIVLLSKNFAQSGWCQFEFKTAHAQMLQDRCPRLLVIIVGDIPEALEQVMQLYLKTNTYLVWGERLFWKKLYYAMPEQRVTTPPTNIMPTTEL